MFDWFWNFLYGISKSIYSLIDGLMSCANMLVGIEPIKYEGTETDFISYLFHNKNITYGFIAAALIGVILVFIFAIFAILRAIASEKAAMTPAQVAVKVVKTLLMFLFIPAVLFVFILLSNTFMQALYSATLGGSGGSMGRFLAGAFGQSAVKTGVDPDFYLLKEFDYTDTDNVRNYLDLSDYDFFFSWLGGICILVSIAQCMLVFVDRAISMVILYIFAPISLSTSVIDDGAHFKLWRDQFLIKFLTGYGCILALNIYAILIAAVTSSSLTFFENTFLNNLMKIAFILGGAVSMNRAMALIGNLIQAGAGSNEMRDNAIATSQFKGALGSAVHAFGAPFRGIKSAVNFASDAKQYGIGSTIANRMGFKTARDYGGRSEIQKADDKERFGNRNNTNNNGGNGGKGGGGSNVQNIMQGKKDGDGGGNNSKSSESSNANNNKPQNSMVTNAINNSLSNNKDSGSNAKK